MMQTRRPGGPDVRCRFLFAAVAAAFAACAGTPGGDLEQAAPRGGPPSTRAGDTVDDYHGTPIADPYRWLEDQDGEEVLSWAHAQDRYSRAVLDALPDRAGIRARLTELWNFERYDAPTRAGSRWFYRRNDGLQNQSVLYVADDAEGEGRVLLDPNSLSADGTVALSGIALDHDGERIAFATSRAGSDWRTWQVLEVESGRTLPDRLEWSKFSGAAWTHDGKGFFYCRFPAPPAGETFQARNENQQLCYHVLGTAQADDRVVYERPDRPTWGFGPQVTEDGRYLVLSLSDGTDRRNRVAYVDLAADVWEVRPLLMDFDAAYHFVGSDGAVFYFRTDRDAANGRVVALGVDDAEPTLREVIGEAAQALQGVGFVGGQFLCSYLVDATSKVVRHGRDGARLGEIALPGIGTTGGFTGRAEDTVTHFSFTTFTRPTAIWRCDLTTGEVTPFRVPRFGRADDDLVSERVFLQSKDGTRLCLFLVHRKQLRLDGSAPCYLYGYGGFGIAVTPRFGVDNLVFVERGGIYAQAVLRGGSEYGEGWHRAGMLGNKQNVFDDFISCAEYLVRNGYTSHQRLVLGGRSNGGLLVGAVLTQRPDLCGAAIPEVGVLDMLRYHEFTIGRAWASEYGRSDDPTHFPWLLAYSPLHNVHAGTRYPPTLVMTGDHDDRVLPGHSYKFTASLQQAQAGGAPILLRVETDAGHGGGTPVHKLIEQAADRVAFALSPPTR